MYTSIRQLNHSYTDSTSTFTLFFSSPFCYSSHLYHLIFHVCAAVFLNLLALLSSPLCRLEGVSSRTRDCLAGVHRWKLWLPYSSLSPSAPLRHCHSLRTTTTVTPSAESRTPAENSAWTGGTATTVVLEVTATGR